MRTVTYKTRQGNESHDILTPKEAEKRGIRFLSDYRILDAKGQFILTDDGFVVEVLRYGQVAEGTNKGKRWIRTCTGTFSIDVKFPYVDTEPRESRFTFNGKARKHSHQKFAIEWDVFAEYLVRGYKPMEAYKMVYPNTKTDRYAHEKSLLLMSKKEVKRIVSKKLEDVFAELEIDDKFILQRYKDLAENADSDSVCIQACNALAEIRGIKGQKQVITSQKVFMGIPMDELKRIEQGVNQVFEEPTQELTEGPSDEVPDVQLVSADDDDEIVLEDGIF